MRHLNRCNDKEKALIAGIEAIKHLPYWVSAGTALGFHRDGDFIGSDTDIDVEILDWNPEEPFTMPEPFVLFRHQDFEGKPIQRAYYYGDTIFDVYFFYSDGDMAVNHNQRSVMKIPLRFFEDRQEIETKYGNIFFPHPIEEYLEKRYGADWRTPSESKGIY